MNSEPSNQKELWVHNPQFNVLNPPLDICTFGSGQFGFLFSFLSSKGAMPCCCIGIN